MAPLKLGTLQLRPRKAGKHVVFVDGAVSSAAGQFTLTVRPVSGATHGTCGTPKALDLSTLPLDIVGTTQGVTNDLKSVNCDAPSSKGT